MSKDCSAHRIFRYIDVGNGNARADRKGEIGKVALRRTLLAWKRKPSGRVFGSILLVSVMERVGGVKYPPRRDNTYRSHEGQGYASCRFQVTYFGREADRQHQTHKAYEDDKKQGARPTNQEQYPQYPQDHRAQYGKLRTRWCSLFQSPSTGLLGGRADYQEPREPQINNCPDDPVGHQPEGPDVPGGFQPEP